MHKNKQMPRAPFYFWRGDNQVTTNISLGCRIYLQEKVKTAERLLRNQLISTPGSERR
jgi:hypothetical protein